MKFTMKQFNERFPTSEACLEELKNIRFADYVCPRCERKDALKKLKGRSQYQCPCGNQVAPLSGTIFHKSPTDLRTWFMTMYMMTQTRAGVSAKTIERTTGVTYKTAWRMMKQIRSVMETGGDLLHGTVEADETYFKAKAKSDMRLPRNTRTGDAETVVGLVERGGRAIVKHVPRASAEYLRGNIIENVHPDYSIVYTDGHQAYKKLPTYGFKHYSVDHGNLEFTRGDVSTQSIENFWRQFKGGMYGVYRHCSPTYLQSYANEYAWRFSNRNSQVPMFELLLSSVQGVSAGRG